MWVWGLDLGTKSGFAFGEPGGMPESGSVTLKKKGEHRAVALGNLVAFLCLRFDERRPDIVVKEAPMSLQAFAAMSSSEANVRMQHSLHGVVEAICARYRIPIVEHHVATIRKHFLGRAQFGERKLTKWECVLRCRLLKYIDKDCGDEDRADALAYWDWACATYGGKSLTTERLFMFGERPTNDEAE